MKVVDEPGVSTVTPGFVTAYSEAPAPVTVTRGVPVRTRLLVPVFWMVKVTDGLDAACVTVPKS